MWGYSLGFPHPTKGPKMAKLLTTLAALLLALTPAPAEAKNPGCPQYEKALAKYLPKNTVAAFSQIAYRESRCNPKSVSAVRRSTGYPDIGLLQVSGAWRSVTYAVCRLRPNQSHIVALTRLDCHLRVARYLYDNGGLGHWRATSGK